MLARNDEVQPEDLVLDPPRPTGPQRADAATLQSTLEHAAAERIRAALESAGGRRAEAAARLGIDRTASGG